jgi:hypothetical protein
MSSEYGFVDDIHLMLRDDIHLMPWTTFEITLLVLGEASSWTNPPSNLEEKYLTLDNA